MEIPDEEGLKSREKGAIMAQRRHFGPHFNIMASLSPRCSPIAATARRLDHEDVAGLHVPFAGRTAAAPPNWIRIYNEERPHASLNKKTPLSKLLHFAEQRS